MMRLGSLGNGGSSSSSANLSASAPPFTVDRSNLKPCNQTWLYPHSLAPKPNFSSNPDLEVDSTRTTYMPLAADDYCYSGYESTNPIRTHWYAVNSGSKAEINANYYPEPRPYYHTYDDTPLVALNEPNYGSLSTTGLVPMDGSFQVDQTQSLSGLEYVPQWGGVWNGFTEGKQGKQIEVNVNFCSEEVNVGGSHVYKNYMKQGHTADSMSKCEEDSAISHGKSSEILGKEKSTGSLIPWQLDDKSFLAQSFSFVPFQSSRTPFCGTSSIHSPVETSLESTTNLLNRQKPYSPYENCFQTLDSSVNGCISVTKSSPVLVIRPPVSGTTSCAPSTVSPKTLDIGNIDDNLGKKKDVHVPLGSKSIEGCLDTGRGHKETNNHNFASSSKEELSSNKPLTKDALNHTYGARSGFQVLDINVLDGLSLTTDSADTVQSIENSSDSLDSPCWKGAPASHFSWEAFEALNPQPLMKNLESCNGLNLHGTQTFPSFGDAVKAASQNISENIRVHNEKGRLNNNLSHYPEKTSDTNYPAKEHMPADTAITGSGCPKLSGSKEVQFSNDLDNPRNEHELPNESKSDYVPKASHTQLSLEEDNFKYTRLKLHTDVCDMGVSTNDASKGGCVPFHDLENISCSPSYGKDAAELAEPYGRDSTPKMDVKMLVKTMFNLSELLLFHCSIDEFTLKEQDREALKHVIGNLDACVPKKTVHRTPTRESMFPLPGTSPKFGVHDLHMGASESRPQVTNVAAANSHVQFNCQYMHGKRRHDNVSGKKVEKFPDFVSLRDDADVLKHDNMVQDIKKVLDENFHSKEDMKPQTLLYKNLWLEAEAELCSLSYKTRFDRMKIEMEKNKSDSDKSKENTKVAEKLPSSNNSPDPNITHILTDEAKDSPILKAAIHDSPISSTSSPVNDVEASVMDRFHILKSRGDNSNPINMERHQVPNVDAGFDGPEDETVKELKEFRICITNDPVIQSRRSCTLRNQLPPVWYDSSSSDWEHVLKDEFSGQN